MGSWFSLARALLAASRAKSTGVMCVATELGSARIAVDQGVLRAATALPPCSDSLGDLLLRAGALDPRSHYEQLRSHEPGVTAGDWLVRSRLVTRPDVERTLRWQLRDRVLRVFACERHELAFEAGSPDVGAPLIAEPTTSEDLVLTALRLRVSSWSKERVAKAIPDGELRSSSQGDALLRRAALWPEEAVVKALLRHGTTVSRIGQATRGSERALRFLAGLCVLSVVTVQAQDERRFSLLVRKREQLRKAASAHELLDLPGDAPATLSRRALRRLVHRLHPDAFGPSTPEALRRASSEVLGALIDAESTLRSR